jgi:hypothetical protein
MDGQVKGWFDWVIFQARSFEGRINCVFDRLFGLSSNIAIKGDGL